MDKTEEFLELYKQLEEAARSRYNCPENEGAVAFLAKRPEFRHLKTELGYCREIRNFLQHTPRIESSFAVIPSDGMMSLIRDVTKMVLDPPLAKDIAVPISSVLYKSMDDLVKPAMAEMQRNVFTHIPVLQNGAVAGVFSENTVFSFIVDGKIAGIDDGTRFSDLREYLPIDKHRAESFRFIPETMNVERVRALFEKALTRQVRIGLLFTTKSGNSKEPLLGIISAWDVAAN